MLQFSPSSLEKSYGSFYYLPEGAENSIEIGLTCCQVAIVSVWYHEPSKYKKFSSIYLLLCSKQNHSSLKILAFLLRVVFSSLEDTAFTLIIS